ncbi:MAG TPA: pilus assembly protein TadG-related protein [Acidimicrobiales bacterium]|nr:pilus assembly protein TadG-related protein [Acidimicrobiales bacterium]
MTTREDSGSLTAFLAVLCLALFVLIGLVVDGGRAVAERSMVAAQAQQAARVGAGQVSVDALRTGEFEIDASAAVTKADSYLTSVGLRGAVSVVGDTVSVRVVTSEPTVVLGIIGIDRIGITVIGSAVTLHGVSQAD